jgi:ketosteroid isomerase-like protein
MAAFNERDVGVVLELADPEIEFYAPVTAEAVGRQSSYQGHEGILQYFDDVGTVWDRLEAAPQDFRTTAEHVVAIGAISGERAGEQIDDKVAWAWKVRNGKVVWGRVYLALSEALEDVGLEVGQTDSESSI